jgi:hypothetical protein
VSTDDSEEHIASIFGVEELISERTSKYAGGKQNLLLLAEIISSTLKMEAICSSETSVDTQQTTQRHIPEDDTSLFFSYLACLKTAIHAICRFCLACIHGSDVSTVEAILTIL